MAIEGGNNFRKVLIQVAVNVLSHGLCAPYLIVVSVLADQGYTEEIMLDSTVVVWYCLSVALMILVSDAFERLINTLDGNLLYYGKNDIYSI